MHLTNKKWTKIICDDGLKSITVLYIFASLIILSTNRNKYRNILSRIPVKNKLPYKFGYTFIKYKLTIEFFLYFIVTYLVLNLGIVTRFFSKRIFHVYRYASMSRSQWHLLKYVNWNNRSTPNTLYFIGQDAFYCHYLNAYNLNYQVII